MKRVIFTISLLLLTSCYDGSVQINSMLVIENVSDGYYLPVENMTGEFKEVSTEFIRISDNYGEIKVAPRWISDINGLRFYLEKHGYQLYAGASRFAQTFQVIVPREFENDQ